MQQKEQQPNKFFNTSMQHTQQHQQQQQTKSFKSSVPENMNLLGGSPSQTFLTNQYTSAGSLQFHQQQSNSFHNQNHSSSTGSIPQQIQTDMSGLSTSPFRSSSGTPSTFINCNAMSPMSSSVDDPMDLDKFSAQNNTLNWLDLNMETACSPPNNQQYHGFSPKDFPSGGLSTSTSNMNSSLGAVATGYSNEYQNIYNNPHAIYGAHNRSQTSIHGSSPKPQDGFVSLFDLEGGGY